MRPFIKHQVCNGVGTFLWHDFWNPLGPILPLFGERILYDPAIHKNARVAEVIDGTRWNWPITVSTDLITLKTVVLATFLIPIERMLFLGHRQRPVFFPLVLHGTPLDLASLWYTGMQLCGSHILLKGTPSYPGLSYKTNFQLKTNFLDGASLALWNVFTVRQMLKIGNIYSLNARLHSESG